MSLKKNNGIKKSSGLSFESRRGLQGVAFCAPWILGFLVFFLYPAVQSIWYGFSKATPIDDPQANIFAYLSDKFVGFEQYNYIWREDTAFTDNLMSSIGEFFYSLPIIIFVSLVFALLLNQDFHGRLIVRAVFFLPVIIASGVVMTYLNGDSNAQALLESSGNSNGMYNSLSFSEMLENMGLPPAVTKQLNQYISSIFSLVWSSGVQTILFLAGLQSISAQYYEVAQVEGSTKWETFWYVTIPMMTNVIVLNVVYTCIDLFTSNSNKVMSQAHGYIERAQYNWASAVMWSYFLILGVIIGALLLVFRKSISKNQVL